MSLPLGTRLGPYEILGRLGAGGMGEVYRARDTRLGRDVALKLLPAALANTPEARARFQLEAQAISRLNHPNICTLYDVGVDGDRTYLVMELLDGETLDRRLRHGPLPVDEVLRIGAQVAHALDAAHRHGIIHRDLKPSNIALTTHGAKLLDFGLARGPALRTEPADVTQSPTVSTPITAKGAIVGTLQYMSPEQLEGKPLDGRSDLWSFGAILYEMVTGIRAFQGESQASIIGAIMAQEPAPISQVAPACPLPLRRLISRCLTKSPEQRWQTAHDLAQELDGMRADRSESSATLRPERPTPGRQAWLRFLGPAVGLVGAAILAFVLFGPQHGPQVSPSVRITPLDLPFPETGYPGLSRDGQWLAVPAADQTGRPGLYFTNVHGGDQRLIFSSPNLNWIDYADISPDGSQIVFCGISALNLDSEVRIVPALGGDDRLVANGRGPQWRPDGQRIGYLRSGSRSKSGHLEMWSVRPDGSDAKCELTDSTTTGRGRQGFTWSPDCRQIAYTRGLDGETHQVIMVRDLASGRTRQITREHEVIDELIWTTRGDIIFSSNRSGSENLWVVRSSGGAATQLTRGPGPDLGIRVSGDGATVLCTQQRYTGQVWIGNLATGAAQQVTQGDVNPALASLSPDGRQVAVDIAGTDPLKRISPLYVMNRDGSGRRRITDAESNVFGADWSPDGRTLAYAERDSTRGDSFYVWVVDPSGGSPRRIARGDYAWWFSDSRLLVSDLRRSSILSMPDGHIVEQSQDSTLMLPNGENIILFDLRTGRGGYWIGKSGSGAGAFRRMDIAPSDVVSFARRLPFILCFNDSLGLYRYRPGDGRRERVPWKYPGLTVNSRIVMNWNDREFAYIAPGMASRLLLITGWR